MRHAQLRTLATRGIEVSRPLKIRGLEAYEAIDGRGSKLVILAGGVLGPSWVNIGFALEESLIQHTLISLGRTYFVVADTEATRNLLVQIDTASKTSSREEVFVQDVGFMASGLQKKFDARVLVAPAMILGITVAASSIELPDPKAASESIEPIPVVSCALDLTEGEFRSWFRDQVANADTSVGKVVIQTDLGKMSLAVLQELGSTQLINGSLECQDGRTEKIQFRTDSLQGGDLVELGERLDP